MRDAFGGVFMMRLMLAFIFIFVAFSAVSLNYAKAFRVKNKVIDVVEQMEIQNINEFSNYYNKIDSIVRNADYNENHCNAGPIKDAADNIIGECYKGIKIVRNSEHSNTDYIYYDIITYGGWNLNALNLLRVLSGDNSRENIAGAWAITGEAKVRNHSSAPVSNAEFSDIIDGDRCYNHTWVRVKKCQPGSVPNAQCVLTDNGRIIFRNSIHVDEGCEIPNARFDDPATGKRCNIKDGKPWKPIYIDTCQNGNIIGAQCYIAGTGRTQTITRTYLTAGSNC